MQVQCFWRSTHARLAVACALALGAAPATAADTSRPLLIQKIVAERLSDKMQIMMVPMDGTNFFANEVFRGAALPLVASPRAEGERRTEEGERKAARR